MVSCCLWFQDTDGPFDAVHLTDLESDEWAELGQWAGLRSVELPAIARLMSTSLPVWVSAAGIKALAAECDSVDWDTLDGPALGGFATLSLVVGQATGQPGAGLRFAQGVGHG